MADRSVADRSATRHGSTAALRATWSFGVPEIDRHLPMHGFDPAAIHEFQPGSYGDTAAALALALRLAVGRQAASTEGRRPIVWCQSRVFGLEWGRPYGPGLAQLGLRPGELVVVEPARQADTLWALEEVLRSGAAAAVIGALGEVDLTEARRLALAAASTTTPGLFVTKAGVAGIGAAHTRWGVRAHASAPHALGLAAPGRIRLALRLERCRPMAACADDDWFHVEWCDVAHRFRLATPLADRAPRDEPAWRRAG